MVDADAARIVIFDRIAQAAHARDLVAHRAMGFLMAMDERGLLPTAFAESARRLVEEYEHANTVLDAALTQRQQELA